MSDARYCGRRRPGRSAPGVARPVSHSSNRRDFPMPASPSDQQGGADDQPGHRQGSLQASQLRPRRPTMVVQDLLLRSGQGPWVEDLRRADLALQAYVGGSVSKASHTAGIVGRGESSGYRQGRQRPSDVQRYSPRPPSRCTRGWYCLRPGRRTPGRWPRRSPPPTPGPRPSPVAGRGPSRQPRGDHRHGPGAARRTSPGG